MERKRQEQNQIQGCNEALPAIWQVALMKRVRIALRMLRTRDSFLLEADTNERSISHKLAEYLQTLFPDLNVDCEYNRHRESLKKLDLPKDEVNWDDTEAKTVFPDIIVHERNTDRSNLLVIEVKKASNKDDRRADFNKLVRFTTTGYGYDYRLGLFLEVSVNNAADLLYWFCEGKVIAKIAIPVQGTAEEKDTNAKSL